eukprot:1143302-Pelagomonas_calceolata.AAC.1
MDASRRSPATREEAQSTAGAYLQTLTAAGQHALVAPPGPALAGAVSPAVSSPTKDPGHVQQHQEERACRTAPAHQDQGTHSSLSSPTTAAIAPAAGTEESAAAETAAAAAAGAGATLDAAAAAGGKRGARRNLASQAPATGEHGAGSLQVQASEQQADPEEASLQVGKGPVCGECA